MRQGPLEVPLTWLGLAWLGLEKKLSLALTEDSVWIITQGPAARSQEPGFQGRGMARPQDCRSQYKVTV